MYLQKRYPSNSNSIGLSDVGTSVLKNRIKKNQVKQLLVHLKQSTKVQMQLFIELRILGNGDPTEYIEQANKLGLAKKIHFDGLLSNGEEVFKWLDNIYSLLLWKECQEH